MSSTQPPDADVRHRLPSWLPSSIRNDRLWSQPDFVRLWSGRAVSQFGTQISLVAIPLYAVLALDASPLQMGLLAAAAGIPRLLIGFIAGAWVDRLRRRPIMLVADFGRALTMATIPLAVLIGIESFALLMVVELLMGVFTVFFQASWAPYLPGLVGRGQLASANSKMIASNSVAQVAGPSLAGTLVGVLGAPVTLALDAMSYLWSAIFISRIEHEEPAPEPPTEERSLLREMRQGLQVLVTSPLLRALTGSHATIILAGHLFLAVYPLYMLNVLDLSARGVGLIYAAGGVGGLFGSLITTWTIRRIGTGQTIVWSAVLFGVFGLTIPMAVLAPAYALPLVLFAEFAQWMTLVVFQIAEGSLRLAVTPDRLLGRVAASDQVLSNGLQPVGAFLGGVLGELFGVQEALLIGVAGMFCAGAWVWWSPVREIGAMPTEPDPSLDNAVEFRTQGTPAS
ncbi:MAG TPA: MFS transporter [Thermomicrobiales bacterium]|nr:MFS transporter [Thermomicrobiales bacterium]